MPQTSGYTQPIPSQRDPWAPPVQPTPLDTTSAVSTGPTITKDQADDLVFEAIINRTGRSMYLRRRDTPLWSAMAAACPAPSDAAEERIRSLAGRDLKQVLHAVQAVHRETFVHTREYFDGETLFAPLIRSALACPPDDLSAKLALELLLHFHRQTEREQHRDVDVLDKPEGGEYLDPSCGEFLWHGIDSDTRVRSVLHLIAWAANVAVSEGGYDLLHHLGYRFIERNTRLDRNQAVRGDKIDNSPPPF